MTEALHYAVRQHLFEQERRWTVDGSGLSWRATDRSGHFDFADIVEIRLEWAATRFDVARHLCRVRRVNGWTETIVSTHFAGPANFEDRRQDYVPFVTSLVAQAAAANPACRFQAGASPLRFWGNIAILLFSALLLAAVLIGIGLPLTGLIAAKLTIVAFLAPAAVAWTKRNRPRAFRPPAIPADVLPEP